MTARTSAEPSPADLTFRLPHILAWEEPVESLFQLKSDYQQFLEQRWAWLAADAGDSDRPIFEAMALLAPERRSRLLRAPAFADGLVRRGPPYLAGTDVANWLLAELAAQGMDTGKAGGIWLCRGDGRIADDGRVEFQTMPLHGITVDDSSPARFPQREVGRNDIVLLSEEQKNKTRQMVDEALTRLGAHQPDVLQSVVAFTEVLALRGEREHPAEFRSGTFDRYIGLVLLTNPHLDSVGPEAIVNALVHESIHNLLFMVEVLYGRFVLPEDSTHWHVSSPWSGVQLGLPSYVHACLVWYGLYWLWSKIQEAPTRSGFDTRIVAGLKERCRKGFGHSPVSRGLAPFRSELSDAVLQALHDVEERMARL